MEWGDGGGGERMAPRDIYERGRLRSCANFLKSDLR